MPFKRIKRKVVLLEPIGDRPTAIRASRFIEGGLEFYETKLFKIRSDRTITAAELSQCLPKGRISQINI
jgi:hypothetical protein